MGHHAAFAVPFNTMILIMTKKKRNPTVMMLKLT